MDAKALLDELMGKDRDLPLGQKKKKSRCFDDPEVCRYHLVAFCPHDLFPNTKSDLGPCEKIHDDSLRQDYLKSDRIAKYEAEFLGYLERLIADLERKIKRCHERLEKEMPLTEHARANNDRISAIAMEVRALLKQAEQEGEDGLVDQAQATMNKVEALNKEKDHLVRAVMPEFSNIIEKEKRMQVCEVCGAMQASTDTEKRLASHLEGRQHMGYFRIRQTLELLKKKREEEREAKRREREMDKSDDSDQDKHTKQERFSEEENGIRPSVKDYDMETGRDRRDRIRQRSYSPQENHERDRDWEREKQRKKGDGSEKRRERYSDRDREVHRDRDAYRDIDRDKEKEREYRDRERGDRERRSGREKDRERRDYTYRMDRSRGSR
ncbi:hypothetical protein O6H91_14G044600 [Diphasiastrum complanatum]|uniref:Uncharacterized protein n=1 Tax=Diphasiastrum complanatum TaxID=34168 RepID=A0ACC2BP19_DIPCM|nr:hypothetical protein O6H91_14G044600 [Diphasiastrum complanatum]